MQYNFKKVHIGKDLTISSIVLLAGIALFFVNKGLGIFIAICGLLMLLLFKKGYRNGECGPTLYKVDKDISKSGSAGLISFLSGSDAQFDLKEGNDGGIIHMEAYYNNKSNIAYVQLFHYVSYISEPMTEMVELNGAKADKLISKL